jgi:hypothetical protein
MPVPERPTSKPKKRGPGRPKTSELDPTSQTRERQRRHREKKREAGRVAVELWIRADWRDAILASDQTLQDAADQAFALLMAKRHGKAR